MSNRLEARRAKTSRRGGETTDLKLFTSSKIKGTRARVGRDIRHTRLEVINLFRGRNWWRGSRTGRASAQARRSSARLHGVFPQDNGGRRAEERRRGNEDIQQLKPEDRSRKVAAISRSSHPSRMSDLFSFNFLHQIICPNDLARSPQNKSR